MGTDVLKSYTSLREELNKAKDNLINVNDNIRRMIGPTSVGNRGKEINVRSDRKRRPDREKTRDTSPPAKRRQNDASKSVFSRLSGPVRNSCEDEESVLKPRIHSRVIRELPSRQEVVAAQGDDEQSRARNRRMFGSLMGTLQKFCQEESRLKGKEEKKAQIEKKLEEQEKQEKINMKKERENLFIDRKRQQLEIRKLEIKMNLIKEFEEWEDSKKNLKLFVKTKTKPHLYYKTKHGVQNVKIQKQLNDCRNSLEIEVEKRRTKLNEEIQEIEQHFKSLEEELFKPNKNENRNRRHEREEEMINEEEGNGDVEMEESNPERGEVNMYHKEDLTSILVQIEPKATEEVTPVEVDSVVHTAKQAQSSLSFIKTSSMERNLTSIVIVTQNDYKQQSD